MTFARRLELAGGVVTGLLGVVVPWSLKGVHSLPPEYYRESMIEILLLFICPGLAVAVGSFAHAAKRRPWGRKLLWVIGAFYVLVTPLLFLLGGYGGGLRQAILVVTPSVTAFVTLAAANYVREGEGLV